MSIPEFTAQASLYMTSNRYRSLAFDSASAQGTTIIPQLPQRDAPGRGGGAFRIAGINTLTGQTHVAVQGVVTPVVPAPVPELVMALSAKIAHQVNATFLLLPAAVPVHLPAHLSARIFCKFAWKTAGKNV